MKKRTLKTLTLFSAYQLLSDQFLQSLAQFKKHFLLVVIASIVDALFFIAFGFFTTPISDLITQQTVLIANQLSPVLAAHKIGLLPALFMDPLKTLTGKLILLILLLFFVTYLVYVLFESTSWWLSRHIAEKPTTYLSYLLGFARINILWFSVYIVYKLLDLLLSLREILLKHFAATSGILQTILLVVFSFLALVAIYSYAQLHYTTLFRIPIFLSVLLTIFCLSFYLATQFLLNTLSTISPTLSLLVGLIVLFPVFILIKTYVIQVVYHVHPQH